MPKCHLNKDEYQLSSDAYGWLQWAREAADAASISTQ